MHTIRKLNTEDFPQFINITANAYPGIKIVTAEDNKRMQERTAQMAQDPSIRFYGLFEENEMWGGMRFHDFTMKLLSTETLVGGLGGVAVDLLHKKERVAYEMVQFFLHHYREKGACMTTLYPFRHDFYRKMGFGYGSTISQYSTAPANLPRSNSKAHVVPLTETDKEGLVACYNRLMARTNGLFAKNAFAIDSLFASPTAHVLGYKQNGEVQGYMVFIFRNNRDDNFLDHDLVVRELVYDHPAALQEMLTFLHTQADQVNRVVFITQEEEFYFLLQDPRNQTGNIIPSVWHESHAQGVGIMYRVIDVPRLFEVLQEHDFNGQTCRIKLNLADSFLPENAGEYGLGFENGRFYPLSSSESTDVTIQLDVAEFSSLITGVIGFAQLHQYGLAQISDLRWLETVQRLFWSRQKPLCMTAF